MGQAQGSRWNHNIHFHPLVMDAIQPGATSALDVGTGNGELAGDLRGALPDVTAVDLDAGVLRAAAANHGGINWIQGDVMTYDFGRTFDVVASVATVHHLPSLPDTLQRLADLTAPGGVVVIVGVAQATTARDRLLSLAGVAQHQWYSRTRNYWEHSAPTVWPPPHTYSEVRADAARVLPGARWQQFALWRYALTWNKPPSSGTDAR
ncbi:MAG TPA: class I SAM-dependent methyltransferase [Aeromicrobium sp.]|jgi:SAM-dependent methyltransferase|nr:class I SAM-dependent methyltransferase [Aeromicrobium sp.]